MGKGARTRLANAEKVKARKEAALKAKQRKKRNKMAASIVAIVLVVGILTGVCINRFYYANGTYLRNKTAATSASATIDAAMMTYYFENTYNSYKDYYTNLYSYYGLDFASVSGIDESTSLKKQYYDEDEGTTQFEQYLSYTKESLAEIVALYDAGHAAGFTLTEDQEALVDKMVEDEDLSDYSSVVTEKDVRNCLEIQNYASFYKEYLESQDDYKFTDTEVEEHFTENRTDYTDVSYLSYSVSYEIPEDEVVVVDDTDDSESVEDETEDTEETVTDEDTSEVEEVSETEESEVEDAEATETEDTTAVEAETEDESAEESEAANEDAEDSTEDESEVAEETDVDEDVEDTDEADDESVEVVDDTESEEEVTVTLSREEAKAFADAMSAAETEDDFSAAAEEAERTVNPSESDDDVQTVIDGLLSENVSYYDSNDALVWAFDESRAVGDTYVVDSNEDNTSTTGTYTVYYIVKTADKDESRTVNVRHILFSTDNYDSAKAANDKAEEVLAEWESGDKTEESFADLAMKYNDDSGSRYVGGLYENIEEGEMVDAFDSWIFDESRQPGDAEIVTTDYGYHIIYFIGDGDPKWMGDVKADLEDEKYDEDIASLEEAYTITYDDDVVNMIPA